MSNSVKSRLYDLFDGLRQQLYGKEPGNMLTLLNRYKQNKITYKGKDNPYKAPSSIGSDIEARETTFASMVHLIHYFLNKKTIRITIETLDDDGNVDAVVKEVIKRKENND